MYYRELNAAIDKKVPASEWNRHVEALRRLDLLAHGLDSREWYSKRKEDDAYTRLWLGITSGSPACNPPYPEKETWNNSGCKIFYPVTLFSPYWKPNAGETDLPVVQEKDDWRLQEITGLELQSLFYGNFFASPLYWEDSAYIDEGTWVPVLEQNGKYFIINIGEGKPESSSSISEPSISEPSISSSAPPSISSSAPPSISSSAPPSLPSLSSMSGPPSISSVSEPSKSESEVSVSESSVSESSESVPSESVPSESVPSESESSVSESSVSESSVSESAVSESSVSESSVSESSVSEASESSISESGVSESVSWPSASSGSEKSSAIVPVSFSKTGYAALFIHEMPEVRFDDILVAHVKQRESRVNIDPRFIEVCDEGTIEVVSLVCDKPVVAGARVEGPEVVITFDKKNARNDVRVTMRLSGIRRGFVGKRFPARTRRQFLANERFINSAYPADEQAE